jgi:hypothetical protein
MGLHLGRSPEERDAGSVGGRPSPSLQRLATESGLVLLDRSANRLWAYNGTAGEIWDLFHEQRPEADIADQIAARYGIAFDVALRDVAGILADWREQGLFGGLAGTGNLAGPLPAWAETVQAAPRRPVADEGLTCRIRDRVIAFHVDEPSLRGLIRILYGHLATAGAAPDAMIELRDLGDGETALMVDGVERLRSAERGQVVGGVNQTLLELVNPGVDWLALIHGGAVALNGRGIALPAVPGGGKTTLVAHLLLHGFAYLADDLVALSAPDGAIVPAPLPLNVKEGSWDLLAGAYPELARTPSYDTPRGPARRLSPPEGAWDRGPVPFGAFVFPRYVPGATTTIAPIAPLDALQRLLGDRIFLGYPLEAKRIEAFIAWLHEVPAYALVHGDAAEAARRFEDLP